MAADCAAAAGFTLFGAGWCLGFGPIAEAVAGGGDGLLLYQDGFADGAVPALGQTGAGAACCYGLVGDLGVAQSREFPGLGVAADCAAAAGFTLFGAGGGFGFGPIAEAVVPVQDVQLIVIAVIPHGDIDGDGTLRCGQITIGRKFGIDAFRADRFQNICFREPCDPDAVDGTAVRAALSEGGGMDPITGGYGNGDGKDLSGGMNTPAAGRVICLIVLQHLPEIGFFAEGIREGQQIVGMDSFFLALGCNDDVPGHFGNMDCTVGIAAGCNVCAAHGDGDRHIFAGDGRGKDMAVRNALAVGLGAFRVGQLVGDGMNGVFAAFQLTFGQQQFQHRIGDMIHALCVGVDAVGQVCGGNAAVPQVNIGHTVMGADR